MSVSKIALLVSICLLLGTHMYYPKWSKKGTEATISWDASGYYMYLPAAFIYKDLKKCGFKDKVLKNYNPTPDFQQAFVHEKSGNYVMKYTLGQALVLSPFFAIGHMWASMSASYSADGFSFPYQFMISMGTLLIAIIGLVFLRKILIQYFDEKVTGLTMLGLVVGSNYANYAAIDGAMTHNTLFTLYTLLMYHTIEFYKRPRRTMAIIIGGLIGLSMLVRPTEILSAIIPICWGIGSLSMDSIRDRLSFFREHFLHIVLALVMCIAVGFLQPLYWKFVSGEWIVYSYQDQGFSWLRPHLRSGIFSYRSGWLIYSPFMVFSLIGFYHLYKKNKRAFWTSFIFSSLFIYVAFAWDIWWYGGSLGQRTMVQAYPMLVFPLAAFIDRMITFQTVPRMIIIAIMALFIYMNIWFTHQAHRGGLLHVGMMTGRYYWKTLLTYKHDSENLKLLDGVRHLFSGKRSNIRTIYTSPYTEHLDRENQFAKEIKITKKDIGENHNWMRVEADFAIKQKEWNIWQMSQWIIEFKNHEETIQTQYMRIQRHLSDNQSKRLFIDLKNPSQVYTHMVIKLWNADGAKEIKTKNLVVTVYNE